MNLDLNKFDLINLVRGVQPAYSVMTIIGKYGEYRDNFGWHWNLLLLKDLTEQELYNIYILCKESWN